MGFRKVDLRPALVAILLLALYSSTLLPGVGVHGDTAKFQFVGKIFGTPHETGYPLYLMLNHFFVLLFPFGTLAFKVNLLSSIFSALACVVMYFLLLKMNIHKTVAFVSALSFGASRCLWSQSLIAEVYSLNVFLISILLYFLIVWYHSRELQFLYIAIAIYAISFGNHLTMVTYAPAILFLILVTDYKLLFNYKVLLIFAALFALSVLQYSYFFFRYYNPSTPYLEMQTPTIYKLVWYLTGGRFKGNMFSFSFYDFITQRLPLFARLLFRNLYIT